jgi:hypothetical protein
MEQFSKFLIIGEAGERPFEDSPSATRLRSWFDVESYEGLKSIAHLTNVYRIKDSDAHYKGHAYHVQSLIDSVKHVVLVGKVAQFKYGNDVRIHSEPLWSNDRFMGLPHPSGLNRQLNTLSDETIRDYVNTVLHMWRYR